MPLCHCEALACTARSTAMRSESFVLRRSQHAEPKAERRAAEAATRYASANVAQIRRVTSASNAVCFVVYLRGAFATGVLEL